MSRMRILHCTLDCLTYKLHQTPMQQVAPDLFEDVDDPQQCGLLTIANAWSWRQGHANACKRMCLLLELLRKFALISVFKERDIIVELRDQDL
jgi:hypothetical protein